LKVWDHTLVIFIGDNGYHHNERNWWNKSTLFERSCRVPCIIVAPGAKEGQVCRALVELVDLYPTVADYCGVREPHRLAGQSLRPLLENPAGKGRQTAYTLVMRSEGRYGQAVRTERWRYIQWSDGKVELYDELNDPQEVHDVASEPRHAALIHELKSLLEKIGPPARPRPA
jgi:iduronate 2-sulfatase